MRKKTRETRAFGVRFPVEWLTILEEIAEKEERSVASLIRIAVKEFIQKRQKGGAS